MKRNRTLTKSLVRLIRSTMSRFLAVFAIVSIGVAFFTGVSGTADIMSVSVDEYNDQNDLKDITLYSNYGFDEDDVRAVQNTEGVKTAEGSRFTDVIAVHENDTWVTRIHSINKDQKINHFVLVKGRMPENDHEVLAENGSDLEPGFPLGASIQVSLPDGSRNENLKSDTFTVVGTIDTPLYLNEIKENSTLSNQYIRSYLYINEDAFDMDYYTELNVLSEKGKSYNSFSDAYENYSSAIRDQIKETAKTQENARFEKLKADALQEYEKGLTEYQEGVKEFEEKISEGEKELEAGEQQIKDGEQQLSKGENELAEGTMQLERQSTDAYAKLAEALAILKSSETELAEKEREFNQTKADLSDTVKTLQEGIIQLQQAKDGLAEIDEGLGKIDDALSKLNDEKTVFLISLLREVNGEITMQELKDFLNQADEIRDLIDELLPESEDLNISQIRESLMNAAARIENDADYLASAEVQDLIRALKDEDPELPISELSYEIPSHLTETIRIYEPLSPITNVDQYLSAFESAQERAGLLKELLDSEEYTAFMDLISAMDEEQPVSEIFDIHTEELDEMIRMLEEASGTEISTVSDLIRAYDELKEELETAREELIRTRKQITDLLTEQGIKEEEIDEKIGAYESLIQQINDGIADGERQLADARAQLSSGYREYENGKREADILIEEGRRKIAEGQREIEVSRIRLNQAKEDLKKGYEALAKARKEGREELEEALKLLNDAKGQIDAMEKGSWTVLDRRSHYASATYHQTIDQMKAIGDIFPLFFILVAALVCMTTMSRMVSEQRSETGTLRALGYTRAECASKYLIYAALATILGAALGSVIGLQTFPRIIYNAWRMMYILPPLVLKTPWKLVLSTAFMFLGGMLMTTWLVIRSDMREVPASLMRPKVLKSGTQTLIERIGFLWKRLSFTWKVTMRNIFRYRRRFIMTVIGVAGCCGLMVTGYGIRDSINSMVDLQFYEILRFEGTASIADEASDEEVDDLIRSLEARKDIASVQMTSGYSAKVKRADEDTTEETVSAQIFKDPSDVNAAYNLRTRKEHTPIELDEEGVVINERLAERLSLKKGDTFLMEDEDGHYMEVKISEICELYIYHYAFMSEAYYQKVSGGMCGHRALFIHVSDENEGSERLQRDLLEEKNISSISFYDETLENFSSMVKSLDLIVWTLIVSSMALAFVVLGNLININVAERQREIATLKVLGFRRKEVQSYIYKENNILTLIGALAGLPLGNYLHHYIMRCIEMDFVMFGRSVKPQSFVISALFTVLFGMIVNRAMAKNLDAIAMVESLKSVE